MRKRAGRRSAGKREELPEQSDGQAHGASHRKCKTYFEGGFQMKTGKKALLMTLCAVMLVVASVMGTMAYLTDRDSVTNTFTVGKVDIDLDEAEVDENGKANPNGERVKKNAYKLLPGQEYDKDPTVHVLAGSEDSYVFVKVENGISAFEAPHSDEYTTISEQIVENGWEKLEEVQDVYYKEYTMNSQVTDFAVFSNFKIATDANTVAGWESITPDSTKINVTAYAVQMKGFDSAAEAWQAAEFN